MNKDYLEKERSCKDVEEVKELAGMENAELSEDELMQVTGGTQENINHTFIGTCPRGVKTFRSAQENIIEGSPQYSTYADAPAKQAL